MTGKVIDSEFNTIQFEKKLQALKDSQESINSCCHWCLENHHHHKKIVMSWLNVLKRVRVEQRLTLFYLANDVIQYSKRRNYHFVESWSTTLQKATTMVRDEKIKHKILRIFKIWEQRNVYGEEFVTDLCGLISAAPTSRKSDEPQEFQSAYLITKIKNCTKLEQDTDMTLKKFKEHNPKMMDGEALCASLKDRAHVDDVEKEMDEYVLHMEAYVNALKLEIKARHNVISLLQQAEQHLDKDKRDVKTVEKAYKVFALKVKEQKRLLEELIPQLNSPIPSPDINAPSPSPDSDLDLPAIDNLSPKVSSPSYVASLYQNPGFYNPVPPPVTEGNGFLNNGFSSFMGSNMPFNMENVNEAFGNHRQLGSVNGRCMNGAITHTVNSYDPSNSLSSLFQAAAQPPPPPDTPAPMPVAPPNDFTTYGSQQQVPLMPPPLPPFCKSDMNYTNSYTDSYSGENNSSYGNNSYNNDTSYSSNQSYQPQTNSYSSSTYSRNYQPGQNSFGGVPSSPLPLSTFPPPPPPSIPDYTPNDEYNPEEEPETWDSEGNWEPPPDLETPESPPMFEKESFGEPIEYHDNQQISGRMDVDHRVLTIPPHQNTVNELGHRKKDIDHRNLISLTGSPKEGSTTDVWQKTTDQDYRANHLPKDGDHDYRLPFSFDALKLPPPPPPPNQTSPSTKVGKKPGLSPRKMQDNDESIDMDLSDDDIQHEAALVNDNLTHVHLMDDGIMEPPPPFPEFSDEADANANDLLDDLSNELDEGDLLNVLGHDEGPPHGWNGPPQFMGPPLPPMTWIGPPGGNPDFNVRGRGNKRGNFRGGDFRAGRHHWKNNWRPGGHRFPRDRGGGGPLRRPFFRGRFRGGY